MDKISEDLVAGALARAKNGSAVPPVDSISQRLVNDALKRAKGSSIDPLVLDTEKDWDFGREIIDQAVFGAFSKSAPEHTREAQKNWQQQNPGKAALAEEIGQNVPELAASALLGTGEMTLASKLAKMPELGKFLTGTNEGNSLMRLASSAIWGAQQGAVTSAIESASGRDNDLGGALETGAGMGILGNVLYMRPLHNTISPEVAQFARDYMKATGSSLRLSQIPGSSSASNLAAKAQARLMRMSSRADLEGLTKSVMGSTGLPGQLASDKSLALARSGIKQRLEQAIPSTNATKLSDDQMSAVFQQLGNAFGNANTPQALAVRLAQNQWINSQKVERMMSASNRLDGLLDPDAVANEVKAQATGYPGGLGASAAASASGNPVDLGLLARGANQFQPQGVIGHIGPKTGLGTAAAGAIAGFGGHELINTLAETALPFAPLAAAGSAAYTGLGALQSTPLYRGLLLRGMIGGPVDPFIPAAVEWKGDEVGNMLRVNPAGAATMRASSPPDSMPGWQRRTFQIESDMGRDPNTFRGSNIGYAQWGDEEQSRYGVKPGDWASEMSGLTKERAYFDKVLGRPTTDSEFYLMHQQGAGGGPALLAGGDTPAWQAIRSHYGSDKAALKAISGNMPATGFDPSKITARQFSQLWADKFNTGLQPSGVQVAPGPTAAPWTTVTSTQNELTGE